MKAGTGTFEKLDYSLLDLSGDTVMNKFATIGAACLAVALAATSPALARDGRHGGGFRGGGFGPGIAAGIVAGSVLGAGYGYGPGYYAPRYYDDSYAYDNGYDGASDPGYARRNGFVCQPGTVFRGEDGRNHLCQ
jgi:hypothetical protein